MRQRELAWYNVRAKRRWRSPAVAIATDRCPPPALCTLASEDGRMIPDHMASETRRRPQFGGAKNCQSPWLAFLAAGLALGCATYTRLPLEDRGSLERDLTGTHSEKYLRLSYYVTPFFGDASKKLLTPLPPEEVRLLRQPTGAPI